MKKLFPVLFFFCAVVYAIYINTSFWITNPDREKFPLRGIDVSHHQGDIIWTSVAKDDVSFVYIKATEADDFKDEKFQFNWREARAAGLKVGAYHFYSLAYGGEIQAQNFINTVPPSAEQLQPVIDLEYVGNSEKRPSKNELANELSIYIENIFHYFNKKPILYTTYDFYDDYLSSEFEEYDIWIRDIYSVPKIGKIDDWKIWQYSSRGSVSGIKGNVDLNVLNQTKF